MTSAGGAARSRGIGPPREIEGPSLVVIALRNLGSDTVVSFATVAGFCEYAGGTLDRIRGDLNSLVVGSVIVVWSAEWVV